MRHLRALRLFLAVPLVLFHGSALAQLGQDENAPPPRTYSPDPPPPPVVIAPAPPPVSPAPASPTPDATASVSSDLSPSHGDDYGIFGPVRFGPLAGAGILARPIAIEGFVKIYKLVGLGLEYAFLPKVTLDSVDVSAYSIGADARLFAFSGSFFLGAGFGYQSATGTNDLLGSATATSLYITPRLGWLVVFDFGLALGLDLGVTIPIGANLVVDSPVPQELIQSEIDKANYFAKAALPDIKMRLGYLF